MRMTISRIAESFTQQQLVEKNFTVKFNKTREK